MLVESGIGGEKASDGEDGIAATVGFWSIPHTPGRRSGVLIRSINGGRRDKVPAANTAARPRRVKAPDDRRPPSASRAAPPTVIARSEGRACSTCRYLQDSVNLVREVGCVKFAQVVSAVGSCVVLLTLRRICPKLVFGQNTSHMHQLTCSVCLKLQIFIWHGRHTFPIVRPVLSSWNKD